MNLSLLKQCIKLRAQGKIEHFYADQKEVYEKLIAAKDEEIKRLTKQNEEQMNC